MGGLSQQRVGLILAAVLVTVLLLDVGWPLVFQVSGPPTVPNSLYLGFCFAQVGLHAVLVALARGWMMARAVSVFVLVAICAWFLRRHVPEQEQELLAYIFLIQWLLVAGAMLGGIAAGYRLQRLDQSRVAGGIGAEPAQFSLRGLVLLMTVACFVAAAATRFDWEWSILAFAMVFGSLFAWTAILLVPAVLASRRWRLWTFLAIVVGSGAGSVFFLWFRGEWVATLLFIVPTGLQAAGLLLLRSLGFRLWRPA